MEDLKIAGFDVIFCDVMDFALPYKCHWTTKMTCGLKSLTLAESEVIIVRMLQVWKCRLAWSESCI